MFYLAYEYLKKDLILQEERACCSAIFAPLKPSNSEGAEVVFLYNDSTYVASSEIVFSLLEKYENQNVKVVFEASNPTFNRIDIQEENDLLKSHIIGLLVGIGALLFTILGIIWTKAS